MKCFGRLEMPTSLLVFQAITTSCNMHMGKTESLEHTISLALLSSLDHLENRNAYFRKLCTLQHHNTEWDHSSTLGLWPWGFNQQLALDFLTGRSQLVRNDHAISSTLALKIRAPQVCVLIPPLYSLCTHDCRATFSANSIFWLMIPPLLARSATRMS